MPWTWKIQVELVAALGRLHGDVPIQLTNEKAGSASARRFTTVL